MRTTRAPTARSRPLPSVLILAGALLWIGRRAPRTDAVRASAVIWGLWVVVTGLTFSFMAGIIHPYYMVALAPGIAGLAGLGGVLLWQRRSLPAAAVPLAAAVAAAGAVAFQLLGRSPAYVPWLRWLVLVSALEAVVLLLLPFAPSGGAGKALRRKTAAAAVAAALAAPLAHSLTTAATAHSGAIVSAGPAATGTRGNFAGLGNFGRQGTLAGPGTLANPGTANSTRTPGGFGGRGCGMGGLLGTSRNRRRRHGLRSVLTGPVRAASGLDARGYRRREIAGRPSSPVSTDADTEV
ncbi:hypothetical protein [Arthrobacter sp. OAP107]|uniref:hypothetical protein n=1 Tax=Arthrobacter sp. OAP107 TaxID=3156445 RepID=UPI003395F625